ncbi:hypothetical protein SAMN05443637_1442 [Pseudonocardia thermophila]|uniref:Uncharacterized protein n=1 Tax=Pseudonocardia thermophila TaxID=1848 RepID=A0A1M7BIT8_PSETH|nr:hypothetical protein SAMN05443637_1442 [Pseudonocardia thermophila]
MPSRPRLAWQVISVYLSVRAQCTQCSRPATRSPVSSKPATSAAMMRSATTSQNSPNPAAARRVIAATVASETGVENNSANAAAVRFLDRNCPTYR